MLFIFNHNQMNKGAYPNKTCAFFFYCDIIDNDKKFLNSVLGLVKMMQKERELKIGKWFSMWIDKNCKGIEELFCFDAVYVESWGPKYTGINAIKHLNSFFTRTNRRL